MTLAVNDLTDGGAPKVELLLTSLAGDVAFVTGYRLSQGYEQIVPGVIEVAVAGAGSWVDYDVPAQQATYRFELFDEDMVSLGFTESVSITLAFTGCWMHNPLAPAGAVQVTLLDGAGKSLSRPVPGSVVYPQGRRVGIAVTGPRRGLKGGVFDVYSPDLANADAIQAFLGGQSQTMTPVVCIRMGTDLAGFRVQSPLYLGVLDIAEEGVDLRTGGEATIQRIRGDEVSRPAPGLFIPLLRRMDLNAFYASRDEINTEYLTRLAANRDYSLAGFGD